MVSAIYHHESAIGTWGYMGISILYVVRQTPPSMGFCRQEYWSGLPCPPPEGLPNPGIEPEFSASPALAGGLFTSEPPEEPPNQLYLNLKELYSL